MDNQEKTVNKTATGRKSAKGAQSELKKQLRDIFGHHLVLYVPCIYILQAADTEPHESGFKQPQPVLGTFYSWYLH